MSEESLLLSALVARLFLSYRTQSADTEELLTAPSSLTRLISWIRAPRAHQRQTAGPEGDVGAQKIVAAAKCANVCILGDFDAAQKASETTFLELEIESCFFILLPYLLIPCKSSLRLKENKKWKTC